MSMKNNYGLFGGNLEDPMQTYEGDEMVQSNEYVYIWRVETVSGTHKGTQVAAIHLGPGQSVKEI
jgi:hypothetical protein